MAVAPLRHSATAVLLADAPDGSELAVALGGKADDAAAEAAVTPAPSIAGKSDALGAAAAILLRFTR